MILPIRIDHGLAIDISTNPSTAQSYGCISFVGIKSHQFPVNLEARILNSCGYPVMLSDTVGYFDRNGIQFGSGYEFPTVAPGAEYRFHHWPGDNGASPSRMAIIAVIGNRT
jgi:hypothetical protein